MDTTRDNPAAAMAKLDELVARALPTHRYTAARTLYEAAVDGLLDVRLSQRLLYGWVMKWATLPEVRGGRGAGISRS